VKDARYSSLRDDPSPFVFIPWTQGGAAGPLTSFELRAIAGAPTALIPGVKSAIAYVNPNVSIEFQTLAAKTGDSISRERLLAALSGFFGGLALLLASIGLYGVMSYNITRRRNEIGIRIALGAEPTRVLRMIMGEVSILVGGGIAIGLGLTIATTRLVRSLLYGLTPNDPLTLALAMAILVSVALLAGYLQARRAAGLDPIAALREE
jgi:putative ABC transport system permease protein